MRLVWRSSDFSCFRFVHLKYFEELIHCVKVRILTGRLEIGSFGFAEGSALCVGAKPNVPLVRLAKIVFKKCAVGKNKNTEALAFGSAVLWLICPVSCLCFILSFISCSVRSLSLQVTFCSYPKVAISERFTICQVQTLIEIQSLI